MLDYSKIEEIIIPYSESPESLKKDCAGKDFHDTTMVNAIRVRDVYLNSSVYKKLDGQIYSLREICTLLMPQDIYELTYCLSLFNSQGINNIAVAKAINKIKNTPPVEYAFLVRDTMGWVFWDYQFCNIIRLFTLERDLPYEILREYKSNRQEAIQKTQSWDIDGENIILSIEKNMMQPHSVFRLILKSGKAIFDGIKA